MKIFKKKEVREKTKIEKRVAKLSSPELLSWTDQVIYSVGRNLSTWQKSQDSFSLEEARVGAEALYAILECLSERHAK